MVVSRIALATHAEEQAGGRLSDEVELYQRTYSTLLRSSGETALRVLESSHRAMGSSLHPLAASDEPDLGAFIYAIRRLPDAIAGADLVIMGQEAEVFARNGIQIDEWEEADAPARRRRWHDSGAGHARGAAGERLRRRRPDPDAGRLPDRVEQAAGAPAGGGLAARAGAVARGVRAGAGRLGRRLVAPARRLGRRASTSACA